VPFLIESARDRTRATGRSAAILTQAAVAPGEAANLPWPFDLLQKICQVQRTIAQNAKECFTAKTGGVLR